MRCEFWAAGVAGYLARRFAKMRSASERLSRDRAMLPILRRASGLRFEAPGRSARVRNCSRASSVRDSSSKTLPRLKVASLTIGDLGYCSASWRKAAPASDKAPPLW